MKTSLYRYFASDGALLYVGVSHNPFAREVQHRKAKDMTLVSRVSIDWFPSAPAALLAEVKAIKSESPLWNVQWNKPEKSPKVKRQAPDYMAIYRKGLAEFESLPISEQEQAVADQLFRMAG